MSRFFSALALAALLLAGSRTTVRADVIAAAPIPDRIAAADMVVIGKITAIEDKTVMGKRYATDKDKTEFKVALIQIAEPLKGAKGLTHVRLGFVPPVVRPAPAGNARPAIFRFPQLNHAVGQEGCFFLAKSADGDLHVTRMYFDVMEKKEPNFEQEMTLARRAAKLLEEPLAGLKSKDAEDRLMTASMLLTKYRGYRPGQNNSKLEPIGAEESKLILTAIAEGDWTRREPQKLSAQSVFQRLALTAKDGFNPPQFKDYQKEFPAYAQQWLKDNMDKYRVQRFAQ